MSRILKLGLIGVLAVAVFGVATISSTKTADAFIHELTAAYCANEDNGGPFDGWELTGTNVMTIVGGRIVDNKD